MPNSLQIGSVYTFNTHAPAILGAVIKNAKLIMSCDLETAMKLKDVATQYEQIFPALPNGAPSNANSVVFHYFLTESGQKIFIADPWIVSASLVNVVNLNFSIDIVNASSEQREQIRLALVHLGVNFTFSD